MKKKIIVENLYFITIGACLFCWVVSFFSLFITNTLWPASLFFVIGLGFLTLNRLIAFKWRDILNDDYGGRG